MLWNCVNQSVNAAKKDFLLPGSDEIPFQRLKNAPIMWDKRYNLNSPLNLVVKLHKFTAKKKKKSVKRM